jgi:hypothetical protein
MYDPEEDDLYKEKYHCNFNNTMVPVFVKETNILINVLDLDLIASRFN